LNILLVVTLFVFLTTGCTVTYRAEIYPIPPDLKIREFQGEGEVISVKSKAKEGVVFIGQQIDTYYADLKQVTDVTVSFLGEELSKRGFVIQDDAIKSITLNVTEMNLAYMIASYNCDMKIEYSTSHGYRRIFFPDHSSGHYNKACNGTIMKGVVDILNDKKLIDFLKSKEKW
jgi:hypothetical protein